MDHGELPNRQSEDPGKGSVGMLDLGGGSTQITFLPRLQGTL